MGVTVATWSLLGALLLVPPLGYAVFARACERHKREPLSAVLAAFLFGGTAGIGIALVLNTFILREAGGDYATTLLLVSIFAAPFVEEGAKALGLPFIRRHLDELEDGLVLGAAVGFGFAATENALYALRLLASDGAAASLSTTALRAISSTLLHGSTAALVGYAYTRVRLQGASRMTLVGGFALAALVHGTYNFLVQLPDPLLWFGFLLGAAMAMLIAGCVAWRIRVLDRQGEAAERSAAATVVFEVRRDAWFETPFES